MTIKVAPVDSKAARYAVENWHYSQTMPVGRSSYFGVWENDRYIGVVIFGRGASPDLGTQYGLTIMQVCELTRVALRAHTAPVSQIVAEAMSLLRRTSPGLRLIVSFADPREGHHGGIYQAMNWLYTGTSTPSIMWQPPEGALIHDRDTSRGGRKGRLLHQRMVSADGMLRQFGRVTRSVKIEDCTPIEVPGKHRYLYPLDRAMRRQLTKLCQPYPTRLQSDHPAGEVSTGDTDPPGR